MRKPLALLIAACALIISVVVLTAWTQEPRRTLGALGGTPTPQISDPYARRIVPVSAPPATCTDNEIIFVTGNGARQCVSGVWQVFTAEANAMSVTRVTSQFNKTTDTALANIPDLSFPVESGKTYPFRAVVFVDASALGGGKFAVNCSCSASNIVYHIGGQNSGGAGVILGFRGVALGAATGFVTTTTALVEISGIITTSSAGNLVIQFAQQVSSGTSSVLPGSYFQRF